jgi:CheY-like chemotaxis protein
MDNPTILLIDEDDDSGPASRAHLKRQGYRVTPAVDEEDAIDRVSHQYLEADWF